MLCLAASLGISEVQINIFGGFMYLVLRVSRLNFFYTKHNSVLLFIVLHKEEVYCIKELYIHPVYVHSGSFWELFGSFMIVNYAG